MIKNLETLSNKILPVLEKDGIAVLKIKFSSSDQADVFEVDYLKQILNPVWYNRFEDCVTVTIVNEYGFWSALNLAGDILSVAAFDYQAKKIQLI